MCTGSVSRYTLSYRYTYLRDTVQVFRLEIAFKSEINSMKSTCASYIGTPYFFKTRAFFHQSLHLLSFYPKESYHCSHVFYNILYKLTDAAWRSDTFPSLRLVNHRIWHSTFLLNWRSLYLIASSTDIASAVKTLEFVFS